jgi:hypothetical protein
VGDLPIARLCNATADTMQQWHMESTGLIRSQAFPLLCLVSRRFPLIPFNTDCLLLSYSGNSGVNGVSYRGGNGKRSGQSSASCTHDPAGGTWWCQGPTIDLEECAPSYTGQQWVFTAAVAEDTAEISGGVRQTLALPSPPLAGTPVELAECKDITPTVEWTAWTFAVAGNDEAVSALTDGTLLNGWEASLSCAGVGVHCHIWDMMKLTPVGPFDRNGVFFLSPVAGSTGLFEIRSYPNTSLIPIKHGQAGPGYCLTAAVRTAGSYLMMSECDPGALRQTQAWQLGPNATAQLLKLPGSRQPPLKALCVVPGKAPPPPSPGPPPVPVNGSGTLKVKGPIHWGNNGCTSSA